VPQPIRNGVVDHIDLCRLDEPRAVESLGLDDLFERDAVTRIEWGKRFAELMPTPHGNPHPHAARKRARI
jgi:tRNA threonylcarbamoyladenosine biosynthesis protein TsaE